MGELHLDKLSREVRAVLRKIDKLIESEKSKVTLISTIVTTAKKLNELADSKETKGIGGSDFQWVCAGVIEVLRKLVEVRHRHIKRFKGVSVEDNFKAACYCLLCAVDKFR